jgi:hypothetical protein
MTYLVSIPISEDRELATFGVKRKQMKLKLIIGSQQPMYQKVLDDLQNLDWVLLCDVDQSFQDAPVKARIRSCTFLSRLS